MKNFLIFFALFYVVMMVILAIYGANWGDYAHKGFAYNLGRSLFWPITILFPNIGKAIGGALIVGLVGYYTLSKK